MNRIGILQGRLSPPVDGQIQAFPLLWPTEFAKAQDAGLDVLEWLYREPTTGRPNPLDVTTELPTIRHWGQQTGVRVRSICADYFVDHPLIVAGAVVPERAHRLVELLHRAATLTVVSVVVPFVGRVPGADAVAGADPAWMRGSALETEADVAALTNLLAWLRPTLMALDLRLCLESELAPERLQSVLASVEHDPHIRICYDTGDRAALGYDPARDISTLGAGIGAVHIKDRRLAGPTVPLGQGVVEFPEVARALCVVGYKGSLVLQVARGQAGAEVADAIHNREWITQVWTEATAAVAP